MCVMLLNHFRGVQIYFQIIKTETFMISNLIREKPTVKYFDVVCNKCEVYFLFDKLLLQFKSFEFRGVKWKKIVQQHRKS